MNHRFFLLSLPFIIAFTLLIWLFGPQKTEAEPVPAQTSAITTLPVAAAAINLNDNLFHPARLTGQNQSVFGPACNTALGDPFSPFNSTFRPPNHYTNPAFSSQYFSYRYRINIPDNYETANNTSIIRVELFDPDAYNRSPGSVEIDTTFYTISHTQPYGPPSTISKQCPGSDQRRTEACVLTTDESETYNPYWFVRLDEMRQNTGSSCVAPSTYGQSHPTQTAFQLYYYHTVSNTISAQPLGNYYGRADNADDTDLRWVSPGGALSYDQAVNVPANSGSFEVNLNNISDIIVDPATGTRTLYLDVTAFAGASENGYDVWAGPPSYTGPANPGDACLGGVPSKVNHRNLHITNCGNTAHSSGGVSIVALDYQPTNYNSTNPITKKLIYIGPEYAGQTLHVSLFDSDAGAQAPVVFYFDTLAFNLQSPVPNPPANPVNSTLTDWYLAFAVNNTLTLDPDLQPGESRNCYPGTCNNTWITPTYRIQVPTLDPDLCVNGGPVYYCTPFYGGWLTVRYLPGYHDTAAWQVQLPTPPAINPVASCPGVFPVAFEGTSHSVTQAEYDIALNTPVNERYPVVLPTYDSFLNLGHMPDVPLNNAKPGDVFLFVGEGFDEAMSYLQWNSDTTCPGCNPAEARLNNSLTWPGNVLDPILGFRDVRHWEDTVMQVGDWVMTVGPFGSPPTVPLMQHIDRGRTLRLVSWNQSGILPGGGPGNDDLFWYKIAQLPIFRILALRVAGTPEQRWLLVEFVGRETTCGQPGTSVGFTESSYEVNEADGPVALSVALSQVSSQTITVAYATQDGTAIAGQDYAAAAGTLIFAPGTISQTLLIPINNDITLEGSETFSVTLSNPTNAVLFGPNPAIVTIVDNEGAAQISFPTTNFAISETLPFVDVPIQLNAAQPYTITVRATTFADTAIPWIDYHPIAITVTIPPGETNAIIQVPIINDPLPEPDETFSLALSQPTPSGVTITGPNPIIIVILDDDIPAVISFVTPSITTEENGNVVQAIVQLGAVHWNEVWVNYATSNGSAMAGQDYTAQNGTLVFAPGVITQTVTIPILNDSLLEGNENFALTLSNPINGIISGTNPAAITIEDDEQPAQISFAESAVIVPEIQEQVQVVIQQNQAHTSVLSVFVSTSDGTATAGQDYTPNGGTMSFNGAAAITLTIQLNNDTLPEGHETFYVTLANPLNGTIVGINPLQITILDDECAFGPTTGPGRIEAEDFDCGGEGTAYHDSTPGNSGSSSYRLGEDVDVWSSAAASQGHYVGNSTAGEWLNYTVIITETGRYDLRLASAGLTTTQVRIEIDGEDVTGTMTLAGTGGSENFFEVAAAEGILLTAGPHQIRLFIITGGANVDYLLLAPTPPEPQFLPLMLRP